MPISILRTATIGYFAATVGVLGSLFAGAFFIATSITLLAEIFHLANRHRKDANDLRSHVARTDWRKTDVARASRQAARGVTHRARLPYHRSYVDRVRVRA